MKKLFTVLAVASAAFSANAQNLVQNPGFETGTLSPWAKGFTASYTEPTVSSANAYTGAFGAGYNASATTGFFQEIPVTAGNTYTASFWYKATGDGTDARIWSNFKDVANTVIYLTTDVNADALRGPYNQYLNTATSWTQHTVTFTVPANATTFTYAVRAYSGSTVSFDDFSLTTGALGTVDFSADALSLVKFTSVSDKIDFAKDAEVSIYNASGQLIMEKEVKKDTSYDVSSLPAGVYYVKGLVKGEKVSQKIIKK